MSWLKWWTDGWRLDLSENRGVQVHTEGPILIGCVFGENLETIGFVSLRYNLDIINAIILQRLFHFHIASTCKYQLQPRIPRT